MQQREGDIERELENWMEMMQRESTNFCNSKIAGDILGLGDVRL